MATGEWYSGFVAECGGGFQHIACPGIGEAIGGPAEQGICHQRFAAHGVDIAQSIGGCDAPKIGRMAYEWCKEIGSLYEQSTRKGHDGGIIAGFVANAQLGMGSRFQSIQNSFEPGRMDFAAAATRFAEGKQIGSI